MRTKGFAFFACLIAAAASLGLGAAELSLAKLLSGTATTAGRIFWYVRVPRTAACLLAGAAIAPEVIVAIRVRTSRREVSFFIFTRSFQMGVFPRITIVYQ